MVISLREDHLIVTHLGKTVCKIRTEAELRDFLAPLPEDFPLSCSSSLDHPEEYTEDAELIRLCGLLRGAS